MKTFDGPLFPFGAPRRVAAALFVLTALAWSSQGICGPIHEAARDGDLKQVEALVKAHPDLVNSIDEKYGQTPLHIAAFNDRMDVAKVLLAAKADVNAKAKNGSTPLHLAAAKGNKDMVELLLDNKADVNAVDNDGWSPFHSAVVWEHKDIQDFLSQHDGKDLPATREQIKPSTAPVHLGNDAAKPAGGTPADKTAPAVKTPPAGNTAPAGSTPPTGGTSPTGNAPPK